MNTPPPLPPNEAAWPEAVPRYGILDTTPEASFERITTLAARLFEVPVASITFVDERGQWVKSCVGLDFAETTRADSFCGHTILGTEVMVVPDTHADPRFQANPYVVGAPHARFYAGAPLVTADGFCLGSLCLLDTVPRSFSGGAGHHFAGLGRRGRGSPGSPPDHATNGAAGSAAPPGGAGSQRTSSGQRH